MSRNQLVYVVSFRYNDEDRVISKVFAKAEDAYEYRDKKWNQYPDADWCVKEMEVN